MSVYLDNSATTKIRKEALEKYISISEEYGNPSSLHKMGYIAEGLLSDARKTILKTLSAASSEVIFTSSGTEANNLAILGRAFAKERFMRGAKIITTEGEHASVDLPLDILAKQGFKIVRIPTKDGIVDRDILESELSSDCILVTMMMVNNETGAKYDTAAISALVHKKCPDALLHIDATQSYLKLPFTQKSCGADMITISSHKIEGPKGVGALIVDSKIIKSGGIAPVTLGGGQENGFRSGTENVPGICAFAEAARLGFIELRDSFQRMSGLRDMLISELSEDSAFAEIKITNPQSHAPHILSIILPKIKSETMLHFLSSRDVYVSSGSACSSNSSHKSSALTAYGKSADESDSSIRISLGKQNTEEDIKLFLQALKDGLLCLQRRK